MAVGLDFVEPLGDSINVHLLTSADDALVARVPPNVAVSPERKVKVLVDMPHVHIFSADEDGRRLA